MKKRIPVLFLLACAIAAPAIAQTNTVPAKNAKPVAVQPAAPDVTAQPAVKKTAQPEASPGMEAEMEAWMAASEPGEHHEHMAKMAGEWDCTVKSGWAGKMEESKGVQKNHMRMGGRYLVSNFQGTMMGQPMNGQAIMGYNNITKKYETVWRDNMGTGMMIETGTCDSSGKVITTTGQSEAPGGKVMKTRTVYTVGDGKYSVEVFHPGADGKEAKMFEMQCVRTKLPGKAAAGADDELDEIEKNIKQKIKSTTDAIKPK